MTGQPVRPTVGAVLRDLTRRPRIYLIARWNWKSAAMSAVIRGVLFFAATIRSGLDAATAASSSSSRSAPSRPASSRP